MHDLSAAELAGEIKRGSAAERFAGARGGLVVVHDDGTELELDEELVALWSSMPFVIIGTEGCGADAMALVDTVVGDDGALDDIGETVERFALASVSFAMLLRAGEGLGVGAALVAESMAYSMLQAGPEFARWRAGHPARPPHPDDAKPRVDARREGDVLRIVLTRPHRRNALDAKMRDELAEALGVAVADPGVVEVVIEGEGPAFCAGGDLDEFGSFDNPAASHPVRLHRHLGRLIHSVRDKVSVHVHGACVGSSMEIPAFAARVVADSDAVFALPELSLGLVPGAGGTASLPARIGRHRTAWLGLTRRSIDAPTALRWGLVDEVS